METKRNVPLILGLAIPVLMILFIAGSIYLPRLFVPPPKFNFLYSAEDGRNYCGGWPYQYFVQNGKAAKRETGAEGREECIPPKKEANLFIHDAVENQSARISFEEAQKLNLISSIKSPDGFEVAYGNRSDGVFPFFFSSGTDYNSRYLKKDNYMSKKLNLELSGNYYYYNEFNFLGWIK